MRLIVAAVISVLFTGLVQAKELTDLYQAVVPAGQSQSAWQQQALAQVLVKVAVDPAVVEQAAVKAELKNAGNYIKKFQAVSSEQGPALQVGLDEQKVQQLLSQQQIAIWGSRRPALVLWLVEQTAQSRQFMQGAAHPVLMQLQQQAKAIGLPLDLPAATDNFVPPLTQDDVWAGNWLLIEQASLAFNADQTLILLFDQPTPDQYRLTWQGYEQGQLMSSELLAANQQQLANDFLQSLVQQMASKYAVQLGSQSGLTELELEVEGLTNFVDQVKVQQMLAAMLSVKQVTVTERRADVLKFKVQLAADQSAFINALSLERRLASLQEDQTAVFSADRTAVQPTEAAADYGLAGNPAETSVTNPAANTADSADELFSEMAAEMLAETPATPAVSAAVPGVLRYRYSPL